MGWGAYSKEGYRMTFRELDKRIRSAVPDENERKYILQGLHEIEESMNQCAVFWMSVSGYAMDSKTGEVHHKTEQSTRFQINI